MKKDFFGSLSINLDEEPKKIYYKSNKNCKIVYVENSFLYSNNNSLQNINKVVLQNRFTYFVTPLFIEEPFNIVSFLLFYTNS